MRIKDMTDLELDKAIVLMLDVPQIDPCYSNWNFDEQEYLIKLNELELEQLNRK